MKYKIEVTYEIITEARVHKVDQRQATRFCPIALATQKRFNSESISANYWVVHGWLFGSYFTAKLPPMAKEFMENFDSGYTVKPFEFEIEI